MAGSTRTGTPLRHVFDLSLVVLAIALTATVGWQTLHRGEPAATPDHVADDDTVASLVLIEREALERARDAAATDAIAVRRPTPLPLSSPDAERLLGGAIAIVALAPERRLIRQDGTVLREGDRATDDVILESIASDALELRVRGGSAVRIAVD